MKTWIVMASLLAAGTAFAADSGSVAFERLSYELAKAPDTSARAESVAYYIDSLSRIGLSPISSKDCLGLALNGVVGGACKALRVEARLGGAGTGGAD